MKKHFLIALVLIGLTSALFAQSVRTGAPKEKAKELQQKLALSDKQCEKVSAIYQESSNKYEKIKKDEHGDNSKMAKALAPIRRETITKIKAQLNKKQAAKFDALVKQETANNGGWSTGWSADS